MAGGILSDPKGFLDSLLKPIQVYAVLEKPNTVYVGPRKSDAEAQFTFTWGDGLWLHTYEYSDDAQKPKKGGGGAAVVGPQRDSNGQNTTIQPNKKE